MSGTEVDKLVGPGSITADGTGTGGGIGSCEDLCLQAGHLGHV